MHKLKYNAILVIAGHNRSVVTSQRIRKVLKNTMLHFIPTFFYAKSKEAKKVTSISRLVTVHNKDRTEGKFDRK